MFPNQPSRFRSCGPTGLNCLSDLRFNELGGTRVPGPTGSKTRPASGSMLAQHFIASDNVDAGIEASDAGTQNAPDAGVDLPSSCGTETCMTASPSPYFPVLSELERDTIKLGIMQGRSRDEMLEFAMWLKGRETPPTLASSLFQKEENPLLRNLRLSDDVFLNPVDPALVREVNALSDDFDQATLGEFMRLRSGIQAYFEPDKDARRKAKAKGELQAPYVQAWQNYKKLRHLYIQAGFDDPPSELNKINTHFKFLGVDVAVHPELQAILEKVEPKLVGRFMPGVMGAFAPRPISDDASNLSPHAIGKAIDIDWPTNAQFSAREAANLDKVLQWLKEQKGKGAYWLKGACLSGPFPFHESLHLATEADGVPLPQREMEQNSEWLRIFLKEFYPQHEKLKKDAQSSRKYLADVEKREHLALKAPIKTAEQAARAQSVNEPGRIQAQEVVEISDNLELVLDALSKANPKVKPQDAIDKGIITLPPFVFDAFISSGARSGLEYRQKKDAMHFEVPLWSPRRQKRQQKKGAK